MSVNVKVLISVKNFHRLIIQLIDGIPTAIDELPFYAPFGMLFILRYRSQVIKLRGSQHSMKAKEKYTAICRLP